MQRPCSDLNTTAFMARVLDDEKPDLVVFTGDNVAGLMEAGKAIRDYSAVVVERQIPWVRPPAATHRGRGAARG